MSISHPHLYATDCRDCGQAVERPMPGREFENVHGIRVFCGNCGRTNWAEKESYE